MAKNGNYLYSLGDLTSEKATIEQLFEQIFKQKYMYICSIFCHPVCYEQ